MKKLLKRAKIYDEENGEKDCETDSKIDFLKKIGKLIDEELEEHDYHPGSEK